MNQTRKSLRYFFRRFNIEPLLFFYAICATLTNVAEHRLFTTKICILDKTGNRFNETNITVKSSYTEDDSLLSLQPPLALPLLTTGNFNEGSIELDRRQFDSNANWTNEFLDRNSNETNENDGISDSQNKDISFCYWSYERSSHSLLYEVCLFFFYFIYLYNFLFFFNIINCDSFLFFFSLN